MESLLCKDSSLDDESDSEPERYSICSPVIVPVRLYNKKRIQLAANSYRSALAISRESSIRIYANIIGARV